MPLFIVETGAPAAGPAGTEPRVLGPCSAILGVAWVDGFVDPQSGRRIDLLDGPDAHAVRVALRTARAPFDRLWPAIRSGRQNVPDTASPPGTTETRPVFCGPAAAAASESIAKSTVK